MKQRNRKRSKSTAFGRSFAPGFSTTFIGVLPSTFIFRARMSGPQMPFREPPQMADTLPPAVRG